MHETIAKFIGDFPHPEVKGMNLVGFPLSHHQAFKQIALSEDCVIISREVGEACTGLIDEGHDSRGFRIHAKSCNWGPMTGFVCADPRLSKKGLAGESYNAKQNEEALGGVGQMGWKADRAQICVSEARLDWLKSKGKLGTFTQTGPRLEGEVSQEGVTLQYALVKGPQDGKMLWKLFAKSIQPKRPGDGDGETPLFGMVNPYPSNSAGHHLNAVTGDYDLFALWPSAEKFEQDPSEDRRIAGMSPDSSDMGQIIKFEDPQIGNISNRGHLIAQLLNSKISADTGFNRNMVHHSDEGGRPFVKDVDLPLIAFVPVIGENRTYTFGIEEIGEFRSLTSMCFGLGFKIFLNKGWGAQLGGIVSKSSVDQGWRKGYTWTGR